MTIADEDLNADDTQGSDGKPEERTGTIVYSPEMNLEIMRQLEELNAMVLGKVARLSPEQQAQFRAIIEQSELIEVNGHLNS